MGNWYLKLEEFQKAAAIFGQLTKVDTKESDYECKSGYAFEKLKDLAKAQGFYKKCQEKATGVEDRKDVLQFANTRLAALSKAAEAGSPTTNQ